MSSATVTTPEQIRPRFYAARDWWVAIFTAVVALVGYVRTLAPGVTLEKAGALTTAAFQRGVPQPPGAPLWTLGAWVWCHALPIGNIAWRLNLLSALTGAAACGVVALLISKSGRMLGLRAGFFTSEEDRVVLDVFVPACASSAGLLLAFSPVLWAQSVVTEVAGLNALGFLATLAVFYRWCSQPDDRRWLWGAAFLWGTSVTTNFTLALLAVALPALVWLTDRPLGRVLLGPVLLGILGVIGAWILMPDSLFHEGLFSVEVLLVIAAVAAFGLHALWRQGPGWLAEWPKALAVVVAAGLGLAGSGYVYVAACTNPPMNWGDCSHWANWLNHVTGGLADRLQTGRTFAQGWRQLNVFFADVLHQFNIVNALLVLPVLFFYRDLAERDRHWLKFLLGAFLGLGLGYLFLANPALDQSAEFTVRDCFLPGHCLYAIWIGYGWLVGLGYLLKARPRLRGLVIPLAATVILLPVISIWRNHSSADQRGHDFGNRLGRLLFQPGGDYPDVEHGAVLFAGTDAGRFLAAHMIFVESRAPASARTQIQAGAEPAVFHRPDVYLISQGLLTDLTYLPNLRDQYGSDRPHRKDSATGSTRSVISRIIFGRAGREAIYPADPLWLPGEADVQKAYDLYLSDLKKRTPVAGEEVAVDKTGQLRVKGVVGKLAVNAFLARDIFEHNKNAHAFYVEESFVIPWMDPYLEPAGLIFKLNPTPLTSLAAPVVARDTAYWDALCDDLLGDMKFRRDHLARKTFSQLRLATAGLYIHWQMKREAEYAFLQAVALCPDNPDANYRFAQFYVDQQRCNAALELLEAYRHIDPRDALLQDAMDRVIRRRTDLDRVANLERQHALYPEKLDLAMQLARGYVATQRLEQFDAVVSELLKRPELAEADLFSLIDLNAQLKRADPMLDLLGKFTERFPKNSLGWFNLALMQGVRGNCTAALPALERALAIDPQLATAAQRDRRLEGCRGILQSLRISMPAPPPKLGR